MEECTETRLIPKVHMLKHAAEFAKRHGALGLYSEARLESFHASFNKLWRNTHINFNHDQPEKMRRRLADSIFEENSTNSNSSTPALIVTIQPSNDRQI